MTWRQSDKNHATHVKLLGRLQIFVTKYDSLISMELVSSDIIFPFLLWSINRVLDT